MENKRPRPLWLMDSPNHSGVAVASLHLAAGMCRTETAPEIFALSDGEHHGDFTDMGCRLHVFPRFGGLFLGRAAKRAALAAGVSLVHALSPDLAGRGLRLARGLGVPLAVTFNRLEEDEIVRASGLGPAHGLVAISRAIMERMVNLAGVARDRVRIIGNGLDLQRLPRPAFGDAQAAPGRIPVVGTLGRLSEKKGQRFFLQAVKLLLAKGMDAEFVVLGDGPDRAALRRLADELEVANRVTFTPHSVSGQLSQFDILVEPSLQEGLGVSVMQAMAMGVPVVASGVGGIYDLIDDGITGVMVPASDPQALADAIHGLLQNPYQRLEMARQARDKIEREFSSDLVAGKLADFYRECLNSFRGWSAQHADGAPWPP